MGVDFEGLLDRVMRLVEQGKKKSRDPNQSWDDTEAGQKYWESKRKLESEKQSQNALLAVEREKESGATIRQNILKDTEMGKSNILADTTRAGDRLKSDTDRYQSDALVISNATDLADAKGKRDLLRGTTTDPSAFTQHDKDKTAEVDPKKKKTDEAPDETTFWGRSEALAAEQKANQKKAGMPWAARRVDNIIRAPGNAIGQGFGWLSERKFWDE